MQYIQGQRYLWKMPSVDRATVLNIASKYSLSMPIAQTLCARGFDTFQAIESFLFSSLEKDVYHPTLLKDAQKAVDRIIYAIDHGQKILISGDYDVDGVTSSALMLACLLPLGANINFFLPHRVKDGYGLSAKTVERAAANGYKLIITVDNGITAFDAAKRAKELGIDLIITDHHRAHHALPDAYAIVNPNQLDCTYPFKLFAGVGVSFKIMSLLYEQKKLPLPAKVYELLLLGTVADVVPLIGENRFWVRHGLHYVNSTQSVALKVLKQNGKVTKNSLSSTDIGFSIAPQINALGRLEDARDGVTFLLAQDESKVNSIGKVLLELNDARKEIERSIFKDVVAQIESKKINLEHENIIIAASNAWPPGVIGLVASRVVGTYGKPAILFHITKDGIAKGSCRSIPEFNMFNALEKHKDLLISFGGHSLAAGLALSVEKVAVLKTYLEDIIAAQLSPDDLKPKITIDAQAGLPDLTAKFVHDMQHLEPFGNENRQPTFVFNDICMVQTPRLLKDAHVKCTIFAEGVIKPLIFFNRPELFPLLLNHKEKPFSLAAQVTENHWNGKVSVELSGVDVIL